jgi:hypothetical protein
VAGRREILIAGSVGMWMLARCPASFAQQQGKVWRIGYLGDRSPPARAGTLENALNLQLVIGVVAMSYTGAVFSALLGRMDFSMSIKRNTAGDRYPSFRYSITTF